MIQFEHKKTDIYQILSFCLGYLKRKILILLKIFINEKNDTPRPQLIIQLAKQQQSCQQNIFILKDTQNNLINKEDQILFQRFVYRIKQLIRNYLPHASISHQLFVYLKKIQTYSFKLNYKFQDYILYILEENPATLHKQIYSEMRQLKNIKSIKKNSPRRYQRNNPEDNLWRVSPSKELKKLSLFSNEMLKQQQQSIDETTIKIIQQDKNNRPIDIFNRSVKSITDCLDCDISIVRGIYFNLQKQKQNCSLSKNWAEALSNNNKLVKQIQEEILIQNRFIKETIKIYDRQHAKYLIRVQKEPDYEKRIKRRCQTADTIRKQYNFSILPDSNRQRFIRAPLKNQNKKNFQTISHHPTQQQRQQLYQQIQKRKNNVLKMKSICISAHKGHLQLCSENKQKSKKLSFTFANLKKAMHKNNSKNAAANLKKKYEIFMNSCIQKTNKEPQIDLQSKIQIKQISKFKKIEKISSYTQRIQWPSQMNITLKDYKKKQYQIQNDFDTIHKNQSQKINIQFLQDSKKGFTLGNYINGRFSDEKNQHRNTIGKFQTIQKDFQKTVKNFMKGNNVNHRNYVNLQHKQKILFQTLNPQLTVKTIKKV